MDFRSTTRLAPCCQFCLIFSRICPKCYFYIYFPETQKKVREENKITTTRDALWVFVRKWKQILQLLSDFFWGKTLPVFVPAKKRCKLFDRDLASVGDELRPLRSKFSPGVRVRLPAFEIFAQDALAVVEVRQQRVHCTLGEFHTHLQFRVVSCLLQHHHLHRHHHLGRLSLLPFVGRKKRVSVLCLSNNINGVGWMSGLGLYNSLKTDSNVKCAAWPTSWRCTTLI